MAKRNRQNSIDVYQYIYTEITEGRLPMGSAISELEIATKLEISRSPVREALKKFEGEGIVTHYTNRGAFVTELTLQDIGELYDLRIVLECYAVKTAVQNISMETLQSLEERFTQLNTHSTLSEYHDADQQLHMSLINASGNRRLRVLYNTLSAQCNLLNTLATDSSDDFRDSRREHLAIVHCLQERNAEKTCTCLKEHIENIKNNTIRRYLNNWNKT